MASATVTDLLASVSTPRDDGDSANFEDYSNAIRSAYRFPRSQVYLHFMIAVVGTLTLSLLFVFRCGTSVWAYLSRDRRSRLPKRAILEVEWLCLRFCINIPDFGSLHLGSYQAVGFSVHHSDAIELQRSRLNGLLTDNHESM